MQSSSSYQSNRKLHVGKSSAPKKIAKIQFGTLPTVDIQLVSELQVSNREFFTMPSRSPALHGCMDQRLGISDKMSHCKTCDKKLTDCAGHFGFIQLELPVFHAGFFKHTLTIMQCVCKKCARVLIPSDERGAILKKMRDTRIDALGRAAIFKKVVDNCKKHPNCQYCSYANGVVKKVGGGCFKIIHEEFRAKKGDINDAQHDKFREEVRDVEKHFPDLKPHVQQCVKVLNPLRVYEILLMIKDEDMSLLWMDSYGRPETLIMWTVPVPPVPIRPSVPQETGGSTEDDITIQLREIIEMNNALRMALDKGATIKMVAEDWEFLQIQVALFINGEVPGIPRQLMGPKAVRGLCQRLKGKQGRFRGNLSGKRVDFSGRTVISPDPNLMVNQVGVPILVAKVMTYPERVNRYNINKLRQCVRNGAEKHPGANIVRTATPQNIFTLQFANRDKVANDLKIGDIVERHMNDGDVVLFNRQPSLHKMSIMAHRVRVMPWRTFRFNECACTPYNADFDGDEMNMHLPQTEEARAEAGILLDITNNLITPRNGEPLVAATQDFLTGAYLMTAKDVFYTREQLCRLLAYLSDAMEHIDLPLPTVWKPRKLWTGKQVFSLLVRPNKASNSFVNIESEEKFYTKDKHFCPQDGYVAFRNGELLSGNLGKKTLGGESKSGLFYVLIRDYGPTEATRCMGRLAKLSARFIGDRGFSIGIDDVTPSHSMLTLKQRILTEGQKAAEEQIEAYKSGKIRLKPGCDALQSLESEVNGILGKIRENCGKEALGAINYRNSALCMAQCGSKGSPLNISQMIACLGQQSVGGSRIQDGFVNRTLPHFPVGALSPAAKGFVANSFFSGLTATEFFFHTMGGREGLVDTAVKTAETGYMARRLMKALEDLSMQYDQTVRNSEQTVVQFRYGDDGLNPQLMEKGDRPVDYNRTLVNVITKDYMEKGIYSNDNSLSSVGIRQLVVLETSKDRFTSLLPQGYQFIAETKSFFNNIADKIEELEKLGNYSPEKDTELIGDLRSRLHKMTHDEKKEWAKESLTSDSNAFQDAHKLLRDNTLRITQGQLLTILSAALNKYHLSMIEPGEAVGAVGAQSLSEPGTQMTLKTFHFAGVASMNVTLGVPRLKEIINASKTISTPIITAQLVQSDSLTSARVVKAQIEKTTLGEISLYICDVLSKDQAYIAIRLDMDAIHNLHLNLDARSVKEAIINALPGTQKSTVLRGVKEKHIQTYGKDFDRLRITPPEPKDKDKDNNKEKDIFKKKRDMYFTIQQLKAALPNVIVKGVPTVSRAVINETIENDSKKYYLLVEGYGLGDVMGCNGVNGSETKSNHILEMQSVLGIEAARNMISDELKYIMTAYGITVDRRHLMLLSDVMTFKGEVLGITRFGVAKMRESVLMLASFEKTTDHLFDAAVHSREDSIVGVSECIIMGVPIPIGTGLFKVLHRTKDTLKIEKRQRLLECI